MGNEGYLFENKSGKYLELIPGNARFHSERVKATLVDKGDFEDRSKLARLLDHHNVDWYIGSVEFRPSEDQASEAVTTEFDLKFKVQLDGKPWKEQYHQVATVLQNASFFDSTTFAGFGKDRGMIFTLSVTLPGENAVVLSQVMAELASSLPKMQIVGIEFWQRDVGSGEFA